MICPHCHEETDPAPERTNWLPVRTGGREYTAMYWIATKSKQVWVNGKRLSVQAVPLLLVAPASAAEA